MFFRPKSGNSQKGDGDPVAPGSAQPQQRLRLLGFD